MFYKTILFYHLQVAAIRKVFGSQAGTSGVQEADMAAGGSGTGGSDSCREALPVPSDPKKKQVKTKSLRAGGKFWKS